MAGDRVSVKDVAQRAGVSLGTVSNVLNRPDRVAEATRSRVRAAIDELGFIRNESARQLRRSRSEVAAYLVLDAGNPFFTDVARGMEEEALARGLSVVLGDSRQDPGREAHYLRLFEELRVAGVFLTPVGDDLVAAATVLGRGTPIVLVDRTADGLDCCSVSVDDVAGGEAAVRHLARVGHRHVAFVGGPAWLPQVADRWAGAERVAGATPGLRLSRVETDGLTVAHGVGVAARLTAPARGGPTAVFCANDLLALGVLQGAMAAGRAVPGELAIVGYDDITFAETAAVPLSSVRQPREDLGRTAVRLLLDERESGHRHERVVFQPELVVRRSSHPDA